MLREGEARKGESLPIICRTRLGIAMIRLNVRLTESSYALLLIHLKGLPLLTVSQKTNDEVIEAGASLEWYHWEVIYTAPPKDAFLSVSLRSILFLSAVQFLHVLLCP